MSASSRPVDKIAGLSLTAYSCGLTIRIRPPKMTIAVKIPISVTEHLRTKSVLLSFHSSRQNSHRSAGTRTRRQAKPPSHKWICKECPPIHKTRGRPIGRPLVFLADTDHTFQRKPAKPSINRSPTLLMLSIAYFFRPVFLLLAVTDKPSMMMPTPKSVMVAGSGTGAAEVVQLTEFIMPNEFSSRVRS